MQIPTSNGMIECSVCHSKLVSPAAASSKTVSRAYDRHKNRITSKQRVLNILLVGGDCMLVGFQPILVYMSKVDGKFNFSPISVNFLTEITKVFFAVVMLLLQARNQKVGEKPLLSISTFMQVGDTLLYYHLFIFNNSITLARFKLLHIHPSSLVGSSQQCPSRRSSISVCYKQLSQVCHAGIFPYITFYARIRMLFFRDLSFL
jgi:hypothetical protein